MWRRKLYSLASITFILACIYFGFAQHPTIDVAVKTFITFYLSFVFFRALFFFFGAFNEKLRDYRLDKQSQYRHSKPMVSILVPCYNEAAVLHKTLPSLMNIDYPNYEIIVIDDGSSDETLTIAEQFSAMSAKAPLYVLTQENGGKASALNHGLNQASGDLVMCVDADSHITPNSLKKGVRHFVNPRVGAVAGFVEISNQQNMLLKLQQLEYLVGLNFTRRALSFTGIVPIVPGPAGMFRREAIFQAGGFIRTETIFAEDAELSLRLLAHGWDVRSEENMLAITEAPENITNLLRQRYRWNRGTYQALTRNIGRLMGRNGIRGTWLAIYLWMETVITPHINFGLILYFLGYFAKTGEVKLFTMWYGYLLALDLLTTILVVYKQKGLGRWIALSVFNKLGYYYMLLTWRLLSLHEEWNERPMNWDKLERTGHLEQWEAA